ncbi:TIGR03557 family F420-dependent LLM class oxidoreductase [Brevibacterium yomogidense]|uniref:TIGR03557 family F420-dependent LLM class oxidoreductase n=1 Tax=Brevibacterium yomogidense TaxID=946573 RepID=UPI0018E0219C|nr:TIGR03557 family F420-dependent LLM class oxidoreductase [Brevibacterium yomogidense]
MVSIGLSLRLEHTHPRTAVDVAVRAEAHGFSGVMAADHFQPWTPEQGQSPFVWSVLAAIGEHTTGDLGPGVTTPSFRWHPAVVAQASATTAAMFPGRHWLGIGSGEAINEHVVAQYWPEAPERIDRMFEATDLIRKLFAGSLQHRDIRYSGRFFSMESTRLWTMPDTAPEVLVAASGPVTAKRVGRSADGIITVGAPGDKVPQLLTRFAEGAREAGRDPRTMTKAIQLHLSWAGSAEEAERQALERWPIGAMPFRKSDIRSPYDFKQLARNVRTEDFAGHVLISPDLDEHRDYIQAHIDMGFDRIYLHHVGEDQRAWVEAFGTRVLPGLRLS